MIILSENELLVKVIRILSEIWPENTPGMKKVQLIGYVLRQFGLSEEEIRETQRMKFREFERMNQEMEKRT